MKRWIREYVPPAVLAALRRRRGDSIVCRGRYRSFAEARAFCRGYDSPSVLAKTLESTLRVKRGEAAYEQDTALFCSPSPDPILLYALALGRMMRPSADTVLDFGGALGSAYFRSRPYRPLGLPARWIVVEQPAHVDAGRREVADGCLRFAHTLEEASTGGELALVHAGCVIQYLENPSLWLRALMALDTPVVLLDRVPLVTGESDVITIEYVPVCLYDASYPAWFFAEKNFRQSIADAGWRILFEEPRPDSLKPPGQAARFAAFLLVRADDSQLPLLP